MWLPLIMHPMLAESGVWTLVKAFGRGIALLFTFDPELYFIIRVSIEVSLGGVLIAAVLGMPFGFLLAGREFPGRRTLVLITNTLVGVPTVVVGLFFFCMFSNTIGVFAPLGLLYERPGMIIALGALGTPLMASLTNNALRAVDPGIHKTALTLGAGRVRAACLLVREARYGIVGAVVVAFGRLISEVGIATMIGGNIRWNTRTMTTFIALESEMGDFEYGFALGMVLLVIVFLANLALGAIRRKAE